MERDLFDDEHQQLRTSFRAWLDKEVVPHVDEWDEAGITPHTLFTDAGSHGFLGFDIPEQYGGGGVQDFRYNTVIDEEIQYAGVGAAGLGMSLLVLERGMDGFERGRNLEKIGQHAQDTAELFFTDVSVPVENRLGNEGEGFLQLVANLPQERLSIAIAAVAAVHAALGWTLDYVQERTAFGQTIGSFQNTRFVLAEIATELDIAQTYVDRCVELLNRAMLTAEDAAKAQWWCTESQKRSIDR